MRKFQTGEVYAASAFAGAQALRPPDDLGALELRNHGSLRQFETSSIALIIGGRQIWRQNTVCVAKFFWPIFGAIDGGFCSAVQTHPRQNWALGPTPQN